MTEKIKKLWGQAANFQTILNESLKLNNFELNQQEIARIITFLKLLQKWNQKINLTAHQTPEELITKDVIDSLYLNQIVNKKNPEIRSGLDYGCGAGFSGIILAILNPQTKIAFLDSDRKKINFVRQACRELRFPSKQIIFLNIRGEEHPLLWQNYFEFCITRATLKIKDFLEVAHYYVQNNGLIFFMAGKSSILDEYQVLDSKGLKYDGVFDYTILPKKYERKIFYFKKF